MEILTKVFIASLVLFFASVCVSAYLDPGTGGYIISGIIPSLIAMLLALLTMISSSFRHLVLDKAKRNKKLTIILIIIMVSLFYFLLFHESATVKEGGLVSGDVVFDETLSGAHTDNSGSVYEGYNLYEGKLIDLDGNIVKNWSSIYLGVLDKDGNYYAQECYECPKFGKYTWDDEVIWEKNIPIHHHILVTEDGNVITFTKEVQDYNGRDVEFDVIIEFSPSGEEISRWSTWDNLEKLKQFHRELELDKPSFYHIPDAHRLNKSIWGGHYDYYHLNYMQLLPENTLSSQYTAFQEGNWLLSFRHGSMIFILDKDTKQVVWRAIYDQVPGTIEGQHGPQMLSNGRILVMDNGRYREWSRVIEINPVTLTVEWEYKADGFFSLSQSHAQRLPNGNTLITESEDGHVFEITRSKEIVWEFYHPDKQNENNSVSEEKWGQRQEIYRMERYSKEFIEELL